jgi:heat shock protein HslJ
LEVEENSMNRIKVLTLFIVLAFIIAACGGDETPEAPEEPVTTEAPPEAQADEPAVEPGAEEPPAGQPSSPLDTMEFVVDPNLIDVTWEWVQRTTTEGTEVLITVPNPEQYTLFFNADSTFSAQLDCNSGSGGYSTDGAGNFFMQLGPMTAAACPPESL